MSKIMIGLPTAENARRANFYDYFMMLEKPVGSIVSMSHGQSPARNRNLIIDQAIKADCTHIFFLDDDVTFDRDIISKLLKHDKDIVTGLYLMRNFPHSPIIFDYADEQGRCTHHFLENGETGLIPIVNCGLGACLIKIEVFKALEEPWIRLGEAEKDHWCDDISFFNRVRAAGFKLYCDLDVQVGHTAYVTISPKYVNGQWLTIYNTDGLSTVAMPAPKFSEVYGKEAALKLGRK